MGDPKVMPFGKNIRSSFLFTCSLELLGGRWALVVLRDVLLGQRRSFPEVAADEDIATNTLTDRLEQLIEVRMLECRRDLCDGRSRGYVPTDSGLELIPVLVDWE